MTPAPTTPTPTQGPTEDPSVAPTGTPSGIPTDTPSGTPSGTPSAPPSEASREESPRDEPIPNIHTPDEQAEDIHCSTNSSMVVTWVAVGVAAAALLFAVAALVKACM